MLHCCPENDEVVRVNVLRLSGREGKRLGADFPCVTNDRKVCQAIARIGFGYPYRCSALCTLSEKAKSDIAQHTFYRH